MNGYNPMAYNQQPQNAYNFNNTPYVSDILDEQNCEVEEYEKKIGKLFGKK